MLSAIKEDHPVIYLEHKLLSDYWLDYLGIGGRDNVSFDVPVDGVAGEVPDKWKPIPLGKLNCIKEGRDVSIASLGVSVHRALRASTELEKQGVSVEVLDLRSVVPLDTDGPRKSVDKTKKLVVVDEDYKAFGLSGEICALLKDSGLEFKYGRVCTENIIPFERVREDQELPNTERIINCVKIIMSQ